MKFRTALNPRTGNIKLHDGTFAYGEPRVLAEMRDPRLKEFFAARLRGEPVQLPRSTK